MKCMRILPHGWLALCVACGNVASTPSTDAAPSNEPATTDAGAQPTDCRSGQACSGAALLATLAGDANQSVVTARGSRSAWLRIRATESDGSAVGHPMRVETTLRSSGPAEFEVLVYVNPAADLVECTTPGGSSSTAAGRAAIASVAWGETTVANGSDDSRDVVIEVRPLATTCSVKDAWELTIAGNAGTAAVAVIASPTARAR